MPSPTGSTQMEGKEGQFSLKRGIHQSMYFGGREEFGKSERFAHLICFVFVSFLFFVLGELGPLPRIRGRFRLQKVWKATM